MSDSISVVPSKSYQVGKLSQLNELAVPAGERLCRIIFKQTAEDKKAGKSKADSMGCFVPVVHSSFVSAFAAQYPQAVAEFIEGLQNKAIRKVWESSKRSPCEADIGMDALFAVWEAEEREERMTGESIAAALKGELGNIFVSFLAKTRGISLEVAENLELLQGIKMNYLPFFQMAAARKPIFDSAAVKEKVVSVMIAFGEYLVQTERESMIVEKALEKMIDAPLRTVDTAGL